MNDFAGSVVPIKTIEKIARRAACVRNNQVKVHVTDDSHCPIVVGSAGGYFTRSGEPIRHPSAYGRRGWSNMIYETDSRVIFVGRSWILKRIHESA